MQRSHIPGWTRRCPHLEAAAAGLHPAPGSETPSRKRITPCGAHRLTRATINTLLDLTLHPCAAVLVRSARSPSQSPSRSQVQATYSSTTVLSFAPDYDINPESIKEMHRPILDTQPETVQTYPQPCLSGRSTCTISKVQKVSRRIFLMMIIMM